MGRRVVSISGELLTQIATEGFQAGPAEVVRCTKGLPPGAELVEIVVLERSSPVEPRRFTVRLSFEHPDWPEGSSEMLDVWYERAVTE